MEPQKKQQKKIGAVVVLVLASILAALMLAGYIANAANPPYMGPHPISLALENRCVTENTTCLNVSYALLSCTDKALEIDELKIVNMTQKGASGLTVYVNGTSIDCKGSPLFVVEPGDTAMVNLIVAYASNPSALSMLHSVGYVEVQVFTPQVLYYAVCNLSSDNIEA